MIERITARCTYGDLPVPSKVCGILADVKPYVAAVVVGTEPALIAEEHACGFPIEPGDPGALAAAIREMAWSPPR